jgi:excisionase family DNA binding protein
VTTDLKTVIETAKLLKVSRMTAWRLVRDGKLRAINIGSDDRPRYRVTENDLEAYIASLPTVEIEASA